MKKLLSLALALCLLAGVLSGCGKKDNEKNSSQQASSSSSAAAVSRAPVSPAPEKMAKAAKVKAEDGLNVRSEPSTDGEILGLAEDGSKLPLLVEKPSDGWYQVEYGGKTAYIYAEYAEVEDVTQEEYNRLKAGGASSETSSDLSSEPSSQSSEDPEDSGQATPSPSPSSAASKPSNNNEDGE